MFLVSTMNFAKVFKDVMTSLATFYRDIAMANQVNTIQANAVLTLNKKIPGLHL